MLEKIYSIVDSIFDFSIRDCIFGIRAKGEKVKPPTFRTLDMVNRTSLQEWVNEVNFGAYYGHRGSFYMIK
jgi:hypothetical protein